jgi:hypothetical protein
LLRRLRPARSQPNPPSVAGAHGERLSSWPRTDRCTFETALAPEFAAPLSRERRAKAAVSWGPFLLSLLRRRQERIVQETVMMDPSLVAPKRATRELRPDRIILFGLRRGDSPNRL